MYLRFHIGSIVEITFKSSTRIAGCVTNFNPSEIVIASQKIVMTSEDVNFSLPCLASVNDSVAVSHWDPKEILGWRYVPYNELSNKPDSKHLICNSQEHFDSLHVNVYDNALEICMGDILRPLIEIPKKRNWWWPF